MKILVYPISENPYLSLIYSNPSINPYNATYIKPLTPSTTVNLILWYFQVFNFRLRGVRLFHLHWIMFSFPFKNPIVLVLSLMNTLLSLLWIKALGYKLVWTAHNITPHEIVTINDLLVTKILVRITDHIIVHSESTRIDLVKLGANTSIITTIPISHYINQYKNTTNRNASRKLLRVPIDSFIFVFFGQIREYKGLEYLIREFNKLKYTDALLLIKGKCPNPKFLEKLTTCVQNMKNIVFDPTLADDDEVQLYMNTADIIVLPFNRVTTSSSAVLALSFYKPIIAPRIGSLTDLPDDVGYFYNISEPDGLYDAIVSAYRNRSTLPDMGKRGYTYIKQFTWENAASKTSDIYRTLLKGSV